MNKLSPLLFSRLLSGILSGVLLLQAGCTGIQRQTPGFGNSVSGTVLTPELISVEKKSSFFFADSVKPAQQVADSIKNSTSQSSEVIPLQSTQTDSIPKLLPVLPIPVADSLIAKQDSTQKAVSGKPTFPLSDTTQTSRIKALPDSLALADSLKKVKPKSLLERLADSLQYTADSSARIEQFTYQRPARFVPDAGQDLKYGLFLSAPATIKKDVVIDSTLENVIISEKMGDMVLRGPISLSYTEYIENRYEQNLKENWQSLIGTRVLLKQTDAIEALFSKITNVDIYVPGGGGALFRTIFGPPRINIRVNGSIDVKAGWATNYNSNANSLGGTGSQNDPVFDQQFQMNVQGTVGDKLQISADWSTQRTFEYENSLRIVYTGYEDEIVQKIEAGNVSLTTPTRYVQGSSALFGLKSTMQIGPLTWTFLVSQQKGKTENKTISGGSQENKIDIPASSYDFDRHFFVSAFYREHYEKVFEEPPILKVTSFSIDQIEVWKQRTTITGNQNEVAAVALLKLGENQPGEGAPFNAPGGPGSFYNLDTLALLQSGVLNATTSKIPRSEIVEGTFFKLQRNVDYTIDTYTGVIHFSTQSDATSAIALAYSVQEGNRPAVKIGDFAIDRNTTGESKGKMLLKLIRPAENPNPNNKYAWDMMLKNIYKLPSSEFEENDLELEIKYEHNNQNQPYLPSSGTNLIEVLNLDRLGAKNTPNKDNKFDFIPGYTVDTKRGEITLPFLRPFDSEKLANEVNGLSDASIKKSDLLFKELYDTNYQAAKTLKLKDKYSFTGKVKGSISASYNLGFNIVEGSVKVLNNNIPLVPNVDYEVDYQVGRILIKNQTFLTGGSNLSIQYESNDLFTLASKNFVGSRFDLDLTQKLKLGFSWLRYSEKPLTDKVRIGEEPKLNNIIGMDIKWDTDSRFLTKLVNYLPGISTSYPSNFTISGEVAQIIPGHPTELNTKLDPGGVAYIDDFEGSRKSITMGVNYTNWSLSSAPDSIGSLAYFDARKPDSSITNYRALLRFYNDLSYRVPIQDIWPERSVSSRDNTISTFSLEYFPKKRGSFNYSTQLQKTIYESNGETWGGIQRALPSYITNFVTENIEFIEFWVQVSDSKSEPGKFSATNGGFLNIDLGYISEDILADGKLNTELGVSQSPDTSRWGVFPRLSTGAVFVPADDNGLDGLPNDQEPGFFKDFVASLETQVLPEGEKERILGDVSGDNYSYAQGSFNYDFINGSEGNTKTQGSQDRLSPDTEDMNTNTSPDLLNDYFRYQVALNPDSLKPGKGFVVSSNENSKWYQIRIPLKNFKTKFGNIQDLSFVKYVRLWLGGFKQDVYLQFASLDLVGSQWLKDSKDSVLSIAVINVEENPDKYDSPPGIVRQKDRTRPDENIQMNEQSLEIKVKELREGDERSITKTLSQSQSLNITNYERLKMFVHGADLDPVGFETPVNYTDTSNYDVEVFLRFGSDEKSYYEISLPLHPDKRKTSASNATWDPKNTFDIDLARLTALKQLKGNGASDTIYVERSPNGYPDGTRITLKGNPTITQIKQFNIGVRNPKNKGTILPLSFSIWVNELRVSGFKEETGWAANTSVGVKLADVASVNFVIEKSTAEFRRVSEDVSSSKANSLTWSVQSTLAADKFLGEKPIINLPLSFSHTEAVSTPKYLSGSDILLDKAAELAGEGGDELIDLNKSVTVSNSFTLSQVRKQIPSDNTLLQTTLDRLSFDFTYSNSFSRNPTVEWSRAWNWRSGLSYSYQFKPDLFLQPLSAPLSVFKNENFFLDKVFDPATLKDWSETKLFLKPTNINWNVSVNRSRSQSKNRAQLIPTDASRQFTATNNFGLGYQISDNLSMTATGSVSSLLSSLLTDKNKQERAESDIMSDLFSKMIRLDFGKDQSYNQNVSINYKIPFLKVLNLTSQYGSQYGWANPNSNFDPKKQMGNNVQWATSISLGSSFRIGDFFNFKKETENRTAPRGSKADTLSMKDKMVRDLTSIAGAFLSLDAITIRFTQTNSFSTQGVAGNSGILNFFPFNQNWWPDPLRFTRPGEVPGPGLLFQLGLSQDPGARIDSSASSNISNKFSQSNSIDWKTGFQPMEKVKVDLSWKVQWTLQKDSKLNVETFKAERTSTSGSYTRSFIAILGDFESIRKALPTDPATGNYKLGNNEITYAFRDGLELFQLSDPISKGLGLGIWNTAGWRDLVPLPNWAIQISGLEKFPLWTSFVQTMSLSHNYTGDYSTSFTSRPDAGNEILDLETNTKVIIPQIEYSTPRISERFGPLIGVSVNFKKPFTSRINYNTGRTISLSTINRQVTTQKTSEVTASVGYTQSGSTLLTFWPFNGNTLKNDIDLSITGSYAIDETTVESLSGKTSTPAQGINRVTFEPRIGYAVSTRVNASAFWRYTQSKPITGSLSAAEISRSEIGMNVHISIQ
ncbi:MAG: cell surface protein SprA [Bacteroidetes bacterium]|nr:cell surface protein SprA [Bacteroidota bacterium]